MHVFVLFNFNGQISRQNIEIVVFGFSDLDLLKIRIVKMARHKRTNSCQNETKRRYET